MKRKPYDEAYKYLFSSPRITCQLLHSFVDIPVRMLNYITMFYDSLLKKSKAGKLPPVLPLLIYNGRQDWNVPFRLEELIEPYLPRRYIPHFEYYPIIEKNYSDETLFEINNLVSAIMIMENSRDEEILQGNVDRVVECLKKEHQEDIKIFLDWYYQMRAVDDTKSIELSIKEGEGIMLAEVAQKLNRKLLNEGIAKGLEQGLEQGKIRDKQEVLIKQLDLKFGIEEEERNSIQTVDGFQKLDAALEAIVLGENKEKILDLLR